MCAYCLAEGKSRKVGQTAMSTQKLGTTPALYHRTLTGMNAWANLHLLGRPNTLCSRKAPAGTASGEGRPKLHCRSAVIPWRQSPAEAPRGRAKAVLSCARLAEHNYDWLVMLSFPSAREGLVMNDERPQAPMAWLD